MVEQVAGTAKPLQRCPVCNGRGYHLCDCWPGDCICGFGDGDCEECRGEGVIDTSYLDEDYPNADRVSMKLASK